MDVKETKNKKHLLPLIIAALFVTALCVASCVERSKAREGAADTAAAVQLDTKVTITCKEKYQMDYFIFEAPVDALYWFQSADTGGGRPGFLLYNKKGKEIDKGSYIVEDLEAGKHLFSVSAGAYGVGDTYSFIITQYEEYGKNAAAGKEQLFAGAAAAPLYENVKFTVKNEKQELCYRFEITETAEYQINRVETKEPLGFEIFDEKNRKVSGGNNLWMDLVPGTYHLVISDIPAGSESGFIITRKGQSGWINKEGSLADKFHKSIERKANEWFRGGLLSGMGNFVALLADFLLGMLVVFMLRFYAKYLKNTYDYKLFGIPFWGLVAVLVLLILLPAFGVDFIGVRDGNTVGGTKLSIILVAADVACMIAMSVMLFRKSRKIWLIPVNIVVLHLFFFFAFLFFLYFIFGSLVMWVLWGIMRSGGQVYTDAQGNKYVRDDANGSYSLPGQSGKFRRI